MSGRDIALGPGCEDNGLAQIVSGLIRQNLEDKPEKRRDFAEIAGRVALVADDARVALTLEFERGRLTVHDGIAGIPDVTIRAGSEDLVNLSLIELLPATGLPDPRGANLRSAVGAMRRGRIRAFGALTHLLLVLRLTRLLSVN